VSDLARVSPKLHWLSSRPARPARGASGPAAPAADGGLLDAVTCAMSSDVPRVGAGATIAALRALLAEGMSSAVVVVDGDGRPRGTIIHAEADEARVDEGATAGDVMSGLLFWLRDDAPVAQAAALMAYERIDAVVIVDGEGRLVGLITSIDVARVCARDSGYLPGQRVGRPAALLERRLRRRVGE
jgi:CBS domain-containing protein